MDTLTDVLRLLRLRTHIFLHSNFCGVWAVDTSGQKKATFHVVAHGDCWLHFADGEAPIPLQAGDLLVLPRDKPHRISSLATPPGPDVPLNQPSADEEQAHSTGLICGYFEFESRAWNPIIEALPEAIVLRRAGDASSKSVDTLIRLMVDEAAQAQSGGDVMLDRLGDALFILVVRTVMQHTSLDGGYLAALADRKLGLAFRAMHAEPSRPWTLDTLGRAAGMSRSAFANRFHQKVGMTTLNYLTRWRMQLAREWLNDPNLAMIDIAERVGYASEAAFSRAFKREFGLTPGTSRGLLRRGK
ncbi:MAG: AraC family transcriptional regulator [Thiobacillus sp.]